MLMCMRTTIDVPDTLLEQARGVASGAGCTVRELMIEGLGEVVQRRLAEAAVPYRMADRSVGGDGLQPGVADLRWESIRDPVHGDGHSDGEAAGR